MLNPRLVDGWVGHLEINEQSVHRTFGGIDRFRVSRRKVVILIYLRGRIGTFCKLRGTLVVYPYTYYRLYICTTIGKENQPKNAADLPAQVFSKSVTTPQIISIIIRSTPVS